MTEDGELPAGDFSSWLAGMGAAILGEQSSDVPCGGCTACCTSSQFVHIEPDETDTLEHIPAELLFPAPRAPRGHVVMGYDERGHCPMLVDDACSIYEHRPRGCRIYDCRIFPATGVELDDADKVLIAQRARRWRFRFPTNDAPTNDDALTNDDARRDALEAAARHLGEPGDPAHRAGPMSATARAVRAVEIYEEFLAR